MNLLQDDLTRIFAIHPLILIVTEIRRVPLSELHNIRLAREYWELLDKPPKSDFTLHTIATKEALGQKTMLAELVIAGKETREKFPLADKYPVHFKKTYLPGALHRDTSEEFAALNLASQILESPGPIGYSPHTIRSCFIPGKTLDRLTPFTLEPPEQNVEVGRKCPELQLYGLWMLLREAYDNLYKLHEKNFFHRDLELHNCTFCPRPTKLFLIDFGAANELKPGEDRGKLKFNDLKQILTQAIFVQCALGKQSDPLAEASILHAQNLFRDASYFLRRIEEL